MYILLKFKHWQLFALTWGSGILLNILTISDLTLMVKLLPLVMLLFTIGTLGWIWAIATGLYQKLLSNISLNVKHFKILFVIPVIYILLFGMGAIFIFFGAHQEMLSGMGGFGAIIVLLHLLSMFCIVCGMRFAAKTLRSVELRREAHFKDYAGEFFLIWFSIIGYWILQPRINKLAGHGRIQAGAI